MQIRSKPGGQLWRTCLRRMLRIFGFLFKLFQLFLFHSAVSQSSAAAVGFGIGWMDGWVDGGREGVFGICG